MQIGRDERTMFLLYLCAVTALFVLYIVPVIIFDFLNFDTPTGTIGDIGKAVFHYFFLIGVPLVTLLIGALSIGVLGWRAAPEGPKELPHYIGYLMLFVTLLAIIIWIIDMSVY